MSRRANRELGVAVLAGTILDRVDKGGGGRERGRAVAAWCEVAGREASSHARGFALREGELLVFVDSSVWATELSMMSEHYRAAINTVLGKETVSSMRFAVSRKAAPDPDAETGPLVTGGAAASCAPVPATANEIAQIRQMATVVKDEELREAAVAAAIAHLEWRKGIGARNEAETAVQRARDPEKSADH